MARPTVLKWIERALIAVGVSLAAWSIGLLTEARYFNRLPAPRPPVLAVAPKLPGDPPSASALPSAAPAAPKFSTGDWIARFEAPTVHLSATVLEGSDDGTLSRGAGHIEETAFPGEGGNVAIAGHRDTTFRAVRGLKIGDPLTLTTTDHVFKYAISKTEIVNPEDVWVLASTDHPTLTLVTCYPFNFIGHAPRRYIITADLVGSERADEAP